MAQTSLANTVARVDAAIADTSANTLVKPDSASGR